MGTTTDRWTTYTDLVPEVARGWRLDAVTQPSRLAGSNGMTIGPDGRLYVTQVFGSQVTAIDTETGEHAVFSPLGSGITGPDDAYFAADGTFFATEPMFGRVTARSPDGTYRTVRDDLPAANGVTMDHAGRRLFIDEFREGGRLMEIDPSGAGSPNVLMDDLAGPNAPAMGPDGLLYFPQVFADQVWCYDFARAAGRLAVDDLGRPTAVKFDSRGRLVVSEASAGRITAIDLATGEREVLAEVPLGIDNVSVGADDRIFVSHYVDGRVAEETRGRQRVLSAPGLLGPHGLAVDSAGTVLFADGLSVGTVIDGVPERRIRLLVDLPTLALGVAEFDDGVLVLGAGGELLRYR
ncbi:MAG: SMP-30/gluconolactonase/LRE family protein, partial [Ilumatobacteraceae bacterium]